MSPLRRHPALRRVLQALGFCIGLALLAWCADTAFSAENRAELDKLRHAQAGPVIALFALGIASVVINGLAFRTVLLPLRRLPATDVIAVNQIASFLAFLPFKLGAVFRVAFHRKRDAVPLVDIVAWLAAFGALSLATLLPMLGALIWRRDIDAPGVIVFVLGAAACIGLGVALGRAARRSAWLRRLSLGSYRIVDHWGPGLRCGALKVLDSGVHAARFLAAASIFGVALPPDRALMYAAVYYLLGAASPAGMLGVREAGIMLLGLREQRDELARLVLTLSATEASAYAALTAPALAWLFRKRGASPGASPAGVEGASEPRPVPVTPPRA